MSIEHGRVLNTNQAATYVGLSPSTMAKLRLSGLGPSYSKLMRRVVYRPADLDAWLALHQRRSTSARGDFIGEDYRAAADQPTNRETGTADTIGNDEPLTVGERLRRSRADRGDLPED